MRWIKDSSSRDRDRRVSRAGVARGPEDRQDRCLRQFLRFRWPFAARHSRGRTPAKQLQYRSAVAQVVRITHSGGFGGAYRFPAPQSERRQRAADCAACPAIDRYRYRFPSVGLWFLQKLDPGLDRL